MRAHKFFRIVIPAIILLTGCVKDDKHNSNSRVAVDFATNIAHSAQTRASDGTWTAGDDVGIFMIQAGQPLTTANIVEGADNRWYTATASVASTSLTPNTASETIYFPVDGSDVDFIAYYPRTTPLVAHIYNIDVEDQTDPEIIDLMWVQALSGIPPTYNKSNPEVTLTFSHMLTKLVINVVAGEGLTQADLIGMTVSITGMYITAPFPLATGVIGTQTGVKTLITPRPTTLLQYDAILLPTTATILDSVSVDFTLSTNEVFTWQVPNGTVFAQGRRNTYTITISRLAVTATGNVTDWTNDTTDGTGTAD